MCGELTGFNLFSVANIFAKIEKKPILEKVSKNCPTFGLLFRKDRDDAIKITFNLILLSHLAAPSQAKKKLAKVLNLKIDIFMPHCALRAWLLRRQTC